MKHHAIRILQQGPFKVALGSFSCGFESVQLCVRDGDGGEFYLQPEPGHIPRIVVGLDYDKWEESLSVLLHETMEMVLERLRLRFSPAGQWKAGHDGYHFFFDHEQFSEACALAGSFLAATIPEMASAWKKRHPKA